MRREGQWQHRPIWRRPGQGHPYRHFPWHPTNRPRRRRTAAGFQQPS